MARKKTVGPKGDRARRDLLGPENYSQKIRKKSRSENASARLFVCGQTPKEVGGGRHNREGGKGTAIYSLCGPNLETVLRREEN